MSGTVVHHVSRNRGHLCSPPGWRERRKLDLGRGSVWKCDCGKQWRWGTSQWSRGASWESYRPEPETMMIPSSEVGRG